MCFWQQSLTDQQQLTNNLIHVQKFTGLKKQNANTAI